MVHRYVFDVLEPFTDEELGVDTWRWDTFVWERDRLLQIRKPEPGRFLRWAHPAWYSVLLLKHDERLSCRDFNPPRPLDLVRLAVGSPAPPPPRRSAATPGYLRLME